MRQETRTRKKYAASRLPRGPQVAPETTPEQTAADQQRRQAVLAGLLARAQALVPDPPDSPTRRACRESPEDEIITEKFRRQGFNL